MRRVLGGVLVALAVSACAQTGIDRAPIELAALSADKNERFKKFEGFGSSGGSSIEYRGWTYFLDTVILDVGLSDRRVDYDAGLAVGSRIRRVTKIDTLLEANRVDYEAMKSDERYAEFLSKTRETLENLPSTRPISTFNRNDQLAYWINLHNVIVLDELRERYPFRRPGRLMVTEGGVEKSLFDAKLTTIEGVPLSLNDIRINIVYRLWPNQPEVIYGFFRGDIGSPSMIPRAYNGSNVYDFLERNARDYVNSVRGVETFNRSLRVSPLYREVRNIFFPNWPEDLRRHLAQYAEPPLASKVVEATGFAIGRTYAEAAAIPPNEPISSSPGAPAVQATSFEATSVPGPGQAGAEGSANFQAISNNSDQVISSAGGSSQTLRGDFLSRVQRKRRVAEINEFWPSLERRKTTVILEDVDPGETVTLDD